MVVESVHAEPIDMEDQLYSHILKYFECWDVNIWIGAHTIQSIAGTSYVSDIMAGDKMCNFAAEPKGVPQIDSSSHTALFTDSQVLTAEEEA